MAKIQDFDEDGRFCLSYVLFYSFYMDWWTHRAGRVLGHGRRVTIVVFMSELFSLPVLTQQWGYGICDWQILCDKRSAQLPFIIILLSNTLYYYKTFV